MEIFNSIKEARQLAAKWKEDYNEYRPHSALDYMTPNRFAASREAVVSASLRSAPTTTSRQETWNQAA